MKIIATILAFLIISTLTIDSNAQSRKGFEIGIDAGVFNVSANDESETGFGLGLTLAYGISDKFTLGLEGSAGSVTEGLDVDGKAIASAGTLFGRLYFGGNDNATRPYVMLGFGTSEYKVDVFGGELKASGSAGVLGAGVDHTSGGTVGFFGELRYYATNFDRLSFEGLSEGIDFDATYITAMAGVRFRIK